MLQPGQIFADRYRISHLIGAGGMAEVYEAKHTLTEHSVAVKLLRPRGEGASKGLSHFALEARIDARVGSPHIARVQDAGIDEETGAPYLVLELLRGKTLARLFQDQHEGRLRVDQALDVLRQVALGLDAAHAYSVVHRDLKPENVFVTETAFVKLLDFGIAKILDATDHVTQELRGTPYYMAVEQANGERVSAQTDIWALGLLAYRALTGRVYWRCANQPGGGNATLVQIIYEITVSPLDPPSARLLEQGLQIDLPEGFDAWFLRCIAREPSRRFGSAGGAVEELQRVFQGCAPDALPLQALLGSPGLEAPPTTPTRSYPASLSERATAFHASLAGVMTARRPRERRLWLLAGATALLLTLSLRRCDTARVELSRAPASAREPAVAVRELAAAEPVAAPAPQPIVSPAAREPEPAAALPRRPPTRTAAARTAATTTPGPDTPARAASAQTNLDIYGLGPSQLTGPRATSPVPLEGATRAGAPARHAAATPGKGDSRPHSH